MKCRKIMASITGVIMAMSIGTTTFAEVPGKSNTTSASVSTASTKTVSIPTAIMLEGERAYIKIDGAIRGEIKVAMSSPSVAKVECRENGKVIITALKYGSTTITIRDKSNKKLGSYKINVKRDEPTVFTMLDTIDQDELNNSVVSIGFKDIETKAEGNIDAGATIQIERYNENDYGFTVSLKVVQTTVTGKEMLNFSGDAATFYFMGNEGKMYAETGVTLKFLEELKEDLLELPVSFRDEMGYDDTIDEIALKYNDLIQYKEYKYIELADETVYDFSEKMDNNLLKEVILNSLELDVDIEDELDEVLKCPEVLYDTLKSFNKQINKSLQKNASSLMALNKAGTTAYLTLKPNTANKFVGALQSFMINDFIKVLNSEIKRTSEITGDEDTVNAAKNLNKILKEIKTSHTAEARKNIKKQFNELKSSIGQDMKDDGLQSIKIAVAKKESDGVTGYTVKTTIVMEPDEVSEKPYTVNIGIGADSKTVEAPSIDESNSTVYIPSVTDEEVTAEGN